MDDPASDLDANRRLSITELGRYARALTQSIARQLKFPRPRRCSTSGGTGRLLLFEAQSGRSTYRLDVYGWIYGWIMPIIQFVDVYGWIYG